MALTRTHLGAHPDTGAPHFHYHEDDPNRTLLITGPASGTVTLADGTEYSVDGEVVSVLTDHLTEIHHHIELQHEETGALGPEFTHVPCEHCDKKGGK